MSIFCSSWKNRCNLREEGDSYLSFFFVILFTFDLTQPRNQRKRVGPIPRDFYKHILLSRRGLGKCSKKEVYSTKFDYRIQLG